MSLVADIQKLMSSLSGDLRDAVREQRLEDGALKLSDPAGVHLSVLPVECVTRDARRISNPARPKLRGLAVETIIERLHGDRPFVVEAAEVGVERRRLGGVDVDGRGDLRTHTENGKR